MNISRIKKPLISLVLIILFVQIAFVSMAELDVKAYKGVRPSVIFDIGHSQHFNNTHLSSALTFLTETYEATVSLNTGNFTFTTFRGADLVIIPAPYYGVSQPSSFFSPLEKLAFKEYIQDGGAVLFLANPYIYEESLRNYSSNNLALNSLLFSDISALNFIEGRRALLNDFDYLYDDQRFIHLENISFLNSHPIISGRDSRNIQELLTFTTFISSITGGDRIINTTYTTYQLDYRDSVPLGDIPLGGVGSQTILLSHELSNSRLVASGSAIMFSDLLVPGSNNTWFDMYDNAILWHNIIDWLFYQSPVVVPPPLLPPAGIFALSIMGVFIFFLVFGIMFFVAGKEVKRAEVSETIIKIRERDARKQKEEQLFDEDFYEEDEEEPEESRVEPQLKKEEKPKEVDMKELSEEVKAKPPKARSRSERRRSR